MCGGGSPKTPTVDPEAERRKAEGEAAGKANEKLLFDARRRRQQKGLLATGDTGGSVLSQAGSSVPYGIQRLNAERGKFSGG